MRKELRRSLFAAACAGAALVGCGGNSSSSSSSSGVPAPAPSPSPSPVPTSAGTYFLVGRAGGSTTPGNIPFADSPHGTSPFGLSYIDPTNLPPPFNVDTFQNQLEAGGTVLPLAAVSEYFPNGAGSASAWGTRYRVYAKVSSSNTAGLLYAVDLRQTSTPPAAPTPVQLTSNTITAMKLCSTAPVVFDNYRSANLSWVLFHVLVGTGGCGTLADQFLAVQLSMGPTSSPQSLGVLEPVEATYDGEGTITGYLAINHTSSPALAHLDTTFKPITTPALPNLVGTGLNGLNTAGGDFVSLATSGSAWLYLDSSAINAVNYSTGTVSSAVVTLGMGDTVNSRGVVDGTKAYIAINNTSGSGIVQIDLANNNAVLTGARDATLSTIDLVGVTSGALVYFGTTSAGVTNLRSAVKSTLVAHPTPLNNALSASQTIDSLMGPNGAASGGPVAFLVGDTVFFTVADSAPGTTGFAKQAFYVAINSSGTPAAATAMAGNVSAVLGTVASPSIATSGANTNVGALVLTAGSNAASGATAPGGAAFAAGPTAGCVAPSTCASLGLYAATGLPVQTVVGSLGSTSLSAGVALTQPIFSVAFDSGPVQAGMPAMLELNGSVQASTTSDLAVYTPTTASSLMQVSGFSQ
jgi:hypothetical protein